MYSNGEDEEKIKSSLKKILEASVKDDGFEMKHSFRLTTVYPGLIIGSGYAHGLKNDEDSKIGFYFDHTSGIPTIPGSSVKGVLRSLFGIHKNKKDRYEKEKQDFIRELTGKVELNVERLVDDIFEGLTVDNKREQKAKSIYNRDIFYEARIVKSSGTTLQEDYLAPHKEPTINPLPIKFIKVSGGTTFEFSFELHDGGGLTSDEKLKLFFKLLQLNGVGAKTNVGYGQFEILSEEQRKQEKANEEKMQKAANESPADKIINEFEDNMPNLVSAYEQGLSNRVKDFKEEFKIKVLEQLKTDLSNAKPKKKDKIEKRIDKVNNW